MIYELKQNLKNKQVKNLLQKTLVQLKKMKLSHNQESETWRLI